MIFDIDDIDEDEPDIERAVIEYVLMATKHVIKARVQEMMAQQEPMEFIAQTINLILESMCYGTETGQLARQDKFKDGSDGFKEVGFHLLEEADTYLDDDERKSIQIILGRLSEIFRPKV